MFVAGFILGMLAVWVLLTLAALVLFAIDTIHDRLDGKPTPWPKDSELRDVEFHDA